METEGLGFGVYVHWPFCESKCPYCDFNSHVRANGIDEKRFLKAYLTELTHMAELAPDRTVCTVFVGGGTPSLMTPDFLDAILQKIASSWRVADDVEITLEANPSSVEASRFAAYKSAGVNRISIGVQSLNDADLKMLGRLHTVDEAKAALDIAMRTFDRVNADFIYARPGQSIGDWRAELKSAIAFSVGHLSLYQLTIEPETSFARLHAAGKIKIPDSGLARALYDATQELCDHAGLPAYEISNNARLGEECRHNLLYWRYGEYAGIGPGAHGRLMISGLRHARSTVRHPESWCTAVEEHGTGIEAEERLDADAQALEMLLMGLRLQEGLDLSRLTALTGRTLETGMLSQLVDDGLIGSVGDRPMIHATASGRLVLNRLILELSEAIRPADAA
ncbi:MAG: radical SAM family heme chaperone HemW [Methyloligellaceae bacterium]